MASKFGKNLKRRERIAPTLTTENNLVTEVISQELLFDYNKLGMFSNEDKNDLITYEKELVFQKKRVGEIAITIGETLEKARDLFYKNNLNDNSYMEWYTSLGYNKDQVYLLRGRYRLYLENPSYKESVQALSDIEVKEVINKATPKYLVNKVLQGELRTGKKIKQAREQNANVGKTIIVESSKSIEDKILEIDKKIYAHETAIKLLREERADLMKKL